MDGKSPLSPFLVHVGVAVNAPMDAGIIGPDIGTLGTPTLLPRRPVLELPLSLGEKVTDDLPVNAVGLLDAPPDQVLAAAGVHRDSMVPGDP